jgi:CBS domain-containing protein
MPKADDYVKGVMSAPVIHVAPNATVGQALRTMIDHDIGSVIIAEGESVVGIFTERDLTRRILDESGLLDRRVHEVMSSPVTTVGPEDEVVFIFSLMADRKIRRLPVVEDGRLIGIVTERDLLRWVDAVATE